MASLSPAAARVRRFEMFFPARDFLTCSLFVGKNSFSGRLFSEKTKKWLSFHFTLTIQKQRPPSRTSPLSQHVVLLFLFHFHPTLLCTSTVSQIKVALQKNTHFFSSFLFLTPFFLIHNQTIFIHFYDDLIILLVAVEVNYFLSPGSSCWRRVAATSWSFGRLFAFFPFNPNATAITRFVTPCPGLITLL